MKKVMETNDLPCGTPEVVKNTLDFKPRYFTHKILSFKNDLNQDKRDSSISVERKTFTKIWWFTLALTKCK